MEIVSSNKEGLARTRRISMLKFAVSEGCTKKRQGEAFRKKDHWSPVGAVEEVVAGLIEVNV